MGEENTRGVAKCGGQKGEGNEKKKKGKGKREGGKKSSTKL